MKRAMAFSTRNMKELLRDPISIVFCLVFPLFLLVLVVVLNNKLPSLEIFELKNFAPGLTVFGFSFLSLFSGMLISKDRTTSFLTRLFASPMTSTDYIVGYSVPLLPIALTQSVIFFLVSFIFGLEITANVLLMILVLIPISLLFIGFGLLFGSVFTDKQVGGIFSIFAWVVALFSGMWLDMNAVGGALKVIADVLPFAHAVDAAKAALMGDYASILPNLLWVILYTLVILVLAILIFKRKMKE